MTQKTYWRGLHELEASPTMREELEREFPQGAQELETDGVSRREFMALMGASAALAGVGVAGCVRKPTQYILPYTNRPEDLIPGEPREFATTMQVGGSVLGLLAVSHDGRPTKVEGNPTHPMSRGATSIWAQASVLSLYNPDRMATPLASGEASTWDDFNAWLDGARSEFGQGAGLALLVPDFQSPSFKSAVGRFKQAYPRAGVYFDPVSRNENQVAGFELAGAADHSVLYELSAANVLVALDSDVLGNEPNGVFHAREFAAARRLDDQNSTMNRLYSVEPAFSITGASADNRLQIPAAHVGEFLKGLCGAVGTALGNSQLSALSAGVEDERITQWVDAVAADLVENQGGSAITVGPRQPAWVHGLALVLNDALGNIGNTVMLRPNIGIEAEPLSAMDAGSVDTLFIVGGNPAYTLPGAGTLTDKLGEVETIVHLTFAPNETSQSATWALPMTHELEAWGDYVAPDGTPSLRQPLIAPLYDAWSEIEFVAQLAGADAVSDGVVAADGEPMSGYAQLRRNWRLAVGAASFESQWRTWLHDGVVSAPPIAPAEPDMNVGAVVAAIESIEGPSEGSMEIVFTYDNKMGAGEWSANGWLHELPDPVSKLTWDNAALIGPATARSLGVTFAHADANEDVPVVTYGQYRAEWVKITTEAGEITIPAFVTPGVAENCVVLPLGYGRTVAGRVGTDVGFDVSPVRSNGAPFIASGTVSKASGPAYELATTQDHGYMEGRPMVREATLDEYQHNPTFVLDEELMSPDRLHSLWEEPNARDGQQWGMSIDLTTCTGCNVCAIACQAENNIPVVGKERILQGREMHWIRLDRYFSGDANNPQAVTQPVGCLHCENAPCEQVCPVAATVHGPEGTNDMAYNRCIGTRYCANNCPYKVRRFNFFNFQREQDDQNPLYRMQKNPNVTVRFRGVMEKCSYCTQRISRAKIAAKRHGDGVVQDGAITPACAQACPTGAIVFGDINDPNSRVSQAKRRNRDYALLSWLNTHTRTTYLGKIRNPNPALV